MSRIKLALAVIGATAVVATSVIALNISADKQQNAAPQPTPTSSASATAAPQPTPSPSATSTSKPKPPFSGGTKVEENGTTSYYKRAAANDVSKPLSSYSSALTATVRDEVLWANTKANRKLTKPKLDKSKLTSSFDSVLQSTFTGTTAGPITPKMPTASAGFNGLGSGFSGFTVNSAPPDTNMDVGATQIVQVVNSGLVVLSKTGTVLYGPVNINTLWSGFGGGCQNDNDGDPVVVYDRLAGRWVISQFAVSHTVNGSLDPYLECVAVSQTSDATGSYYRYAFGYSVFNDYPKMSVWPDAYYTSFNGFDDSGYWSGSFICGYERAKMLLGQTAAQTCTSYDLYYGAPLVASVEGTTPPAAGTPAYALSIYDSSSSYLALWRLTINWTGTPSISKSAMSLISIPAYTVACPTINSWTCVQQRGTTNQLDTLGDRMMFRFVYRKIGTQTSFVAAHTVDSGGVNSVRWYEFRPSGATLVKYQAGTYQPDLTHRWMPSISMDKVGNIAMVYSSSSSTLYPSVTVAGRLATDTLGTLGQGESIVKAGTGSQTGTLTRWGDYAAMVVDPADDCTFWSSTEYLAASGTFNWKTWISKFKFSSCAADATSYTVTGPSNGGIGVASTNFTVTTNGPFTGTITVTPAGAGVDTTPIDLVFDGTSTTKTFTVTPTEAGTVTFTVSNSGSLTDPTLLPSYTAALLATAFTFEGPSAGYKGQASGVFTVTPNGAYSGTITVTRTGTGNTGSTVLTFNGSSAPQTFTFTPASTGVVTLTATNSGGLTNPSALTYTVTTPPPAITAITASGAIGSTITITGSNLSSSSRVKIGTIGVTSFKVVSATSVTAVVAPGTTGGQVTIVDASGQTATSVSSFAVTYPASTATTISPTSAKVGGSLILSGTNLANVSAVSVAGISASGFSVNSTGTRLYVAVPAGVAAGAGKRVVVTTPNGDVTSTGSFTIQTGTTVPSISSLSTSRAARGATVTISGRNLASADAVYFNGVAAPFVVLSDTSILAGVPLTTTGMVTVHTVGGTSSGKSFTYSGNPVLPTISSSSGISPTVATVGSWITVSGSNFAGLTSVTFNGTPVVRFWVLSATKFMFVVPDGASSGTIVINTTGGTVTSTATVTIY